MATWTLDNLAPFGEELDEHGGARPIGTADCTLVFDDGTTQVQSVMVPLDDAEALVAKMTAYVADQVAQRAGPAPVAAPEVEDLLGQPHEV